MYRYHFIVESWLSDPLGVIPRQLLSGDPKQIVVGTPQSTDTESSEIYLVTQIPFEEVYKFISAATA